MCPMASRLRSMTEVMSTNVVGVKLHSSGWWGSNRNRAGGRVAAEPARTPPPAARARRRAGRGERAPDSRAGREAARAVDRGVSDRVVGVERVRVGVRDEDVGPEL